jgi:hypothetical protein
MTDSESQEVAELEAAAEWRLRLVDVDPADRQSAAAAERLQRIADDLRAKQALPIWRELGMIMNWIAESDDISDFVQLAHEYRRRIGIDAFPENGEDYLRALLQIARETFGSP